MNVSQEAHQFRGSLAYLHEESLVTIATIAGIVGYIWLWGDIWPATGNAAPLSSWLGGSLLALSALASYYFRRTHLRLTSHFLIWCICGAIACGFMSVKSTTLSYLFILPVIFAGVLLNKRSIFALAVVSILLIALLNVGQGYSLFSSEVLFPSGIISLITIASWLSARNLHVTLAWFGDAYKRAHHNEQMAREREAELRRVLKTLDELTYRLERANYRLTIERNQADEARRLKQEFAQTISHELRTPLNLIVAFTELMAQSPEYYGEPLPPVYMRDLNIAYRNARHLQTLINDVLDLARLESAQMSVIPEETDPGE